MGKKDDNQLQIPSKYRNKEEYVQSIFSSIAHRYDLLNTVLSFNRDKYWRRFAVAQCQLKPGGIGLDVACGTGMLCIEQAKVVGHGGQVLGIDFCEDMLAVGQKNISRTPYKDIIQLKQGNAIDLPLEDNTFDCATIGFALRNVPDIKKTIEEMRRVVKPGGKVVSLELSKPSVPIFKQAYYLYFERILPLLGKIGVGKDGPYSYLPQSLKVFPHQREINDLFIETGLKDAKYYELTGGIVSVHVGTK
ncbi:demethylmenaquinone methyltransferase [Desulfofalx alkaliphila]|uniref:demethylmenaquinone methyltransferase n=1 Tax=Desulfofalx alkaliphila TaxID=105483 RepID=UPI00069200B8|nr:demethylmenaquinone methyltransferase [Desulfofalx alkaliphila]